MNSSECRKECHWLPAHLSSLQQARQSQRLPFQWSAADDSLLQSNPHKLQTAPSPQRSARHLNELPKWGRKKGCCFILHADKKVIVHFVCMIYFLLRSSLEDMLDSVGNQTTLVGIDFLCNFLSIQWKSIGTRNCLKCIHVWNNIFGWTLPLKSSVLKHSGRSPQRDCRRRSPVLGLLSSLWETVCSVAPPGGGAGDDSHSAIDRPESCRWTGTPSAHHTAPLHRVRKRHWKLPLYQLPSCTGTS